MDGIGYVIEKADVISGGAFSWVGDKVDDAMKGVGTIVRRGTREITGDQRLSQNAGDYIYAGLSLFGPKKALRLSKFAKLEKGAKISNDFSKIRNVEQKFDYLDLANTTKNGNLIIRKGQEWKLRIEGKAQRTKTPGHRLESLKQAIREAKNPEVDKVYLNSGYHKALKKNGGGN